MPLLACRAFAPKRNLTNSGQFAFVISGGFGLNLHSLAVAAGWDGVQHVLAIITGNVGSSSNTVPALTIDGTWPNGVEIVINPGVYVVGRGGNMPGVAGVGQAGGPALKVASAVTIRNYGVIGGGGGSGGDQGGSGAGYGGGSYTASGLATPPSITNGGNSVFGTAGGAPGSPGANGSSTQTNTTYDHGGGGGGLGAAGGTGYGDRQSCDSDKNTVADGVDGVDVNHTADSCWYTVSSYAGGSGGACVSAGNNLITWKVTGTRYGSIAA